MNVFVEYHHGDLYHSLHLLFEERLKWNLYAPIGLEWFHKGFWKIAEPYGNALDTVGQFLEIPKDTWNDDLEPIQRYGRAKLIDGVYHIPAKIGTDSYIIKFITFNKFLEMNFDFVIASFNRHDHCYKQLVKNHKPNAIYIRQVGNTQERPHHSKNVLLAVNTPMPPNINYVKYHPEHHKQYCYTPPTNHKVVKSFIADPHHSPDIKLLLKLESSLPDFTFKIHGIDGRDGVISGDLMPQVMKDAAFVWHVKHTGCGGFVPRQALASGRPCIIKKHYCHEYHTLVRDLFVDSVNCIDLDLGTTEQNIEKLKYFSEPQRHTEMCNNTAEKFKRDVDFGTEAENIKQFLEGLKKK